jgi:heme/copper-type cytochrome/quinol oxidase subunit 4
MTPFVRNLLILAAIAVAVVLLNLETALLTVSVLLRLAFVIAIAVIAYFYWRDFGRREISTWPQRAAWVFYGAVALLVVDIGWWMLGGLAGRDLLVAVLVAAACGYAGYRTWREQRNLA